MAGCMPTMGSSGWQGFFKSRSAVFCGTRAPHLQVVGRLKTETWTDKVTNQPRKSIKVVADQVNRVRAFQVS